MLSLLSFLRFFKFNFLSYVNECFPAFVYLHHVCLELELDSYEPVVVLGIEPGSSLKAASVLKH